MSSATIRQAENAETFASALRRMRRAKGLTQRQVAQALGQTTRTVQNLEAGVHYPGRRAFFRLRDLLGKDLPVP